MPTSRPEELDLIKALVTGLNDAHRADFIFGWESLGRPSEISVLPEPPSPHPMALISPPHAQPLPRVDDEIPLASTAPLAPLTQQALELAMTNEVVVLAAPTLMHDGGRGALMKLLAAEPELMRNAHRLRIACVSNTPLLSLHGRGAELGAIVGAAAQQRELEISRFVKDAHTLLAKVGVPRDADPYGVARMQGSGMLGGLAFVLALAGAYLHPAEESVAATYSYERRISQCDLLIALVDDCDPERLVAGRIPALGALAQKVAVPFVVVGEGQGLPRRALAQAGITNHYDRANRTFSEMGRSLAATWLR